MNEQLKSEKSCEIIRPVIQKSQISAKYLNQSYNDNLYELYERRMQQNQDHEACLIATINKYYTKNLSLESEIKNWRAKILVYSHKEIELKKEISGFEIKHADLVRSVQDLKHNISELNKLKQQSELDNKKLVEQYENCRKALETTEQETEDTINNMQKTLDNLISQKKLAENKMNDAFQKVKELDKLKQALENKNKELEKSLSEKSTTFDLKCKEYDTLKADYDNFKAILSYVKENAKFN
jgi:chromosome segregation ATPase